VMRAWRIRTWLIRSWRIRSSGIEYFLMQCRERWQVAGIAVLAVAGMSGALVGQAPMNGGVSARAVITFSLDFPESDPSHYSIMVDAAGHATYECMAKADKDAEAETYRSEFEVSAGNRERIFEWAKQAKYFAGKVDSGNQKLAFTGEKILSYQDEQRSYTTRYNYSNVEPVRQLTGLFQNIAGTLDYGRRLTYYHRYQKLALDEEMKRMEAQARNNELSEIQGVAPVLQQIVDDTSVINVVRARAKELIQMGSGGVAGR
jgi:hypothetical protein